MKLKAVLQNTNRPDKNGQCSIAFYAYINGQIHYLASGQKATKKEWDERHNCFKSKANMANERNAQLERKRIEYEVDLTQGKTFDQIKNKHVHSDYSLTQFIGLYIEEVKRGLHEIRESTRRHYECTQRILYQYCKWKNLDDLTFNSINQNFYNDFHIFLTTIRSSGNEGFSNHIKRIKKFMGVAKDRGLHENREYTKRGFKTFRSNPDKIYLDESEIHKLEMVDLSDRPDLERERDRWLLQFYTLTRFEDSIRMNKNNLTYQEGKPYLLYEAQKTGKKVMIPLKPAAETILAKYNWALGSHQNAKSNLKIKRVCLIAGITTIVKEGNREAPKCDFVTTHTARRSAAIRLSLAGVPLTEIMDLGGWDNINTVRVYLKHAKVDSAKKAIHHKFFQ